MPPSHRPHPSTINPSFTGDPTTGQGIGDDGYCKCDPDAEVNPVQVNLVCMHSMYQDQMVTCTRSGTAGRSVSPRYPGRISGAANIQYCS
jgi:hypothetical protein